MNNLVQSRFPFYKLHSCVDSMDPICKVSSSEINLMECEFRKKEILDSKLRLGLRITFN